MSKVELRWRDRHAQPDARDVLVRLIALTDNAYEEGRLDDFLMDRVSPTDWVWTADLPDDLRTTYHFCPVRDHPLRGRRVDEKRWLAVIAGGEPDPNTADQLPAGCVFGAVEQPASVLAMPSAPPQPWLLGGLDRPISLDRHELEDGSIVRVQSPRSATGSSALAVLFDGTSMVAIGVPVIVDTLQAAGVVGPLTTVYVESIRGSAARGPSRVQSLTDRDHLVPFVSDLLVPLLERAHALDSRAERRVVAGHSLGGLAALHVGTSLPEIFGSVVVGSAALWWPGDRSQLSGEEVITATVARPPGTLWMELGTEEGRELVEANRRLRAALARNGRPVHYRELSGGHDLALWRGGVGDGFAQVLGE